MTGSRATVSTGSDKCPTARVCTDRNRWTSVQIGPRVSRVRFRVSALDMSVSNVERSSVRL